MNVERVTDVQIAALSASLTGRMRTYRGQRGVHRPNTGLTRLHTRGRRVHRARRGQRLSDIHTADRSRRQTVTINRKVIRHLRTPSTPEYEPQATTQTLRSNETDGDTIDGARGDGSNNRW
ncbi:hypothetical protein CSX11_23985 [Mycobacterium goodii]|nr:hypothetical protein CSX11_23985 [Mycolicibacterium goodii]